MSQNLIIVESPSKASTIRKYLGDEYKVLSTVGHIRDLPRTQLGVDLKEDFKPLYVIIPGKKKNVEALKEAARKATQVFIATDPDREGEAIGWHVTRILKNLNKPTHRVMFFEITKNGVLEGMRNATELDMNLVNAQQARRIIDRLVGFKVSPFLWRVLYSGLSAGRVQSVALRLICERQEAIDRFEPQEYWTIKTEVETEQKHSFSAELQKVDGKKAIILNETVAMALRHELKEETFTISSVEKKRVRRNPRAPFTTSTMQQAAFQKLGFTTKRTMTLAQQLYEGITLQDGETTGLITYMRTDSTRVASSSVETIRAHVLETFGAKYLPAKERQFGKNKGKIQDAHEAIRPSNPALHPDVAKASLTGPQAKLYDLIWRRFTASQMAVAVFDQSAIEIQAGSRFGLRAAGSDLVFDGYRKVYFEKETEKESHLPSDLKKGELLELLHVDTDQHFTQPPAPYTESSLVKVLDKEGIGRPSTYANIISVVQARNYVQSEKRKLFPTELGKVTNKLLIENFSDLVNTTFTREMESRLDKVEEGSLTYLDIMQEFWALLEKWLADSSKSYSEIKKSLQEDSGEVCEKCGKPMVIKWSKNGRFLACSGFPTCRNARPLDSPKPGEGGEDEEAKDYGKCEKCGSPLILRDGRYGKFYACSAYPKCKFTKPFTILMPCPKPDCKGEISPRRSKRGRTFYGCTKYPDCDFVSWDPPIAHVCPACQNPYMVVKSTKKKGDYALCPKCKHEISVSDIEDSKAKD
ncbi:MAG: type I DNA topoisomerase [Candidatus Marinimicrobia bacterium]|nr:type I DNA topoisomerase [Candidatus Neomarinimicrobiota bacterium]